jgi:hypothetical protein
MFEMKYFLIATEGGTTCSQTGRSSFIPALVLCYHNISRPLIARRRPSVVEDRCKKYWTSSRQQATRGDVSRCSLDGKLKIPRCKTSKVVLRQVSTAPSAWTDFLKPRKKTKMDMVSKE